MNTTITINTEFVKGDVDLEWGQYFREDGEPAQAALQLLISGNNDPNTFDDEGDSYYYGFAELAMTATVNLAGCGIYPALGNIIVKNYSENEGILDSLIDAGVVKEVVNMFSFGYVNNGAAECVLTDEYRDHVLNNVLVPVN